MIRQFGESALLVELDSAGRAQALATALRADPLPGILALVPGLESLLVELQAGADAQGVAAALERVVPGLPSHAPSGRVRTIPVCYGGEDGPDLEEVAALCALTPDEVILRHTTAELRVLFLGFAPGFAYLGELPTELRVPRLATPRTRTPSGSVAIAGSMSGIYPADLPGGWRIIGRTDIRLFDPLRDPPTELIPGDLVRFERVR